MQDLQIEINIVDMETHEGIRRPCRSCLFMFVEIHSHFDRLHSYMDICPYSHMAIHLYVQLYVCKTSWLCEYMRIWRAGYVSTCSYKGIHAYIYMKVKSLCAILGNRATQGQPGGTSGQGMQDLLIKIKVVEMEVRYAGPVDRVKDCGHGEEDMRIHEGTCRTCRSR